MLRHLLFVCKNFWQLSDSSKKESINSCNQVKKYKNYPVCCNK